MIANFQKQLKISHGNSLDVFVIRAELLKQIKKTVNEFKTSNELNKEAKQHHRKVTVLLGSFHLNQVTLRDFTHGLINVRSAFKGITNSTIG